MDLEELQGPLDMVELIVKKYDAFIEYMIQRLKEEDVNEEQKEDDNHEQKEDNDEGEKEEDNDEGEIKRTLKLQRWIDINKRGKKLVKEVLQLLESTGSEMERLKGTEYAARNKYIPRVLILLGKINVGIATSPHIRIVSNIKITTNAVSLCLGELRTAKQRLNMVMEVIKRLKQGLIP